MSELIGRELGEALPGSDSTNDSRTDQATEDYTALTDAQRRFLAERWRHESDLACARALGLNERTPGVWKGRDEVYRRAYAHMKAQPVEYAREQAQAMGPEAMEKLLEMLRASGEKHAHRYIDQVIKVSGLKQPDEAADVYWEAFVTAARAIAGKESEAKEEEEERDE